MHKPVLLDKILKVFDPQSNENYIDCTINGGGHSLAILDLIKPKGKVLGIDWDRTLIDLLGAQVNSDDAERLILVSANYAHLKNIVKDNLSGEVSGILFDLGFSSYHIEGSRGGFSFLRNEELDMRYNRQGDLPTARELLASLDEEELVGIFKNYGQERFSKNIARAIVEQRTKSPIKTTNDLVSIIEGAVPGKYRHGKIHFATRSFQALRIAVNRELENIKQGIGSAIEILRSGGKLSVISFHSLEDSVVKNLLREAEAKKEVLILTKKPIMASARENNENRRARSAKLRIVQKI